MKKFNNQKTLKVILGAVFLSSVSTLNAMNDGGNEKETSQNSTTSVKQEMEQTQQPIKKTIKMVPTDFNVNRTKVTVSLPYEYRTINPNTTRFFFEGEALIIDPENMQFDSYITSPLLPCMLGRILDPQTGRSLVFHKYPTHNLASLTPYYEKLGSTNPSLLDVELYSCEISPGNFKMHALSYDKNTQAQEIISVRNWLRDNWEIPQNNITIRFFRSEQYLKLPALGRYENCPTTLGVTKTGELFHTSLFDGDIFGLGQLKLPRHFKKKGSFGNLNLKDQQMLVMSLTTKVLSPTIRNVFVKSQNDLKETRDTKDFFVTVKLDLPSSSLAKFFNVILGDEKIECDIPSELKNN